VTLLRRFGLRSALASICRICCLVNRELLPDLFRRVVGVYADAEAHAQHAFFARGRDLVDAWWFRAGCRGPD
jgi:hypothetical protein